MPAARPRRMTLGAFPMLTGHDVAAWLQAGASARTHLAAFVRFVRERAAIGRSPARRREFAVGRHRAAA